MGDGSSASLAGVLSVIILVVANGFFVASEFSLVAMRRSRVAQLVAAGRVNARALQNAVEHLDYNLAACQLGITLSSLALGWIGEPALAHLIEPLLILPFGTGAEIGAHAIAIIVAFAIITILHIVLGELAPKSLALQRTETTALIIVRPLSLFGFLLKPAIVSLNGLGTVSCACSASAQPAKRNRFIRLTRSDFSLQRLNELACLLEPSGRWSSGSSASRVAM